MIRRKQRVTRRTMRSSPGKRSRWVQNMKRRKGKMTEPKYPSILVDLSTADGNAFAILGRAKKAVRRSDLPAEDKQRIIDEYEAEAKSGDYDHLIQTTMAFFETE